jgi:hypothetical protein
MSLILSHLDIVYGAGGGAPAAADTSIDSAVATAALRVYSRFDVNRDGAVTLMDVDAVRANLGKLVAGGAWESELAGRCDLDGDGEIAVADLTQAMAKYEETVP